VLSRLRDTRHRPTTRDGDSIPQVNLRHVSGCLTPAAFKAPEGVKLTRVSTFFASAEFQAHHPRHILGRDQLRIDTAHHFGGAVAIQ
jgi:hypothetical protein